MGFIEGPLAAPRPDALAALDLPRRRNITSPDSWQEKSSTFCLSIGSVMAPRATGRRWTAPSWQTPARPDGGQPWQWPLGTVRQ
jgi:hypothetical protein